MAQAPDDPAQLEPVVVTVTRMEQKAGDAPASVTVLTRDDMHYSGTQTVDDLLRQVPGFSGSSIVWGTTPSAASCRSSAPGPPSAAAGPVRISLEGNYFSTDGYDVVKSSRRGSIDIEADSTHSTFNGRVELLAAPEASFFVSGFYYYARSAATARRCSSITPEPAAGRSAAASAHSTTANCASRPTPAESA